jgi:negative regulator of flagellin synthesis FlgM
MDLLLQMNETPEKLENYRTESHGHDVGRAAAGCSSSLRDAVPEARHLRSVMRCNASRKDAKVASASADRTNKTRFFRDTDMKIEQSTQLNATQAVKEARGSSVRKPGNTSDDVRLSSLASQLLASEDAVSFDAGRVAEIKQAISEGKFSINADAIADRLIASARELLDSRHRV